MVILSLLFHYLLSWYTSPTHFKISICRLSPIMPPRRNRPKVHVSVTFAPTKSGSNPSLMIQNPIDLTELVGTFYPEEFVRL